MGLPSARNTALHNVSGEYIIHCDSDDWVEPEMCQLMYKCAIETDADIVGCGFYELHSIPSIVSPVFNGGMMGTETGDVKRLESINAISNRKSLNNSFALLVGTPVIIFIFLFFNLLCFSHNPRAVSAR